MGKSEQLKDKLILELVREFALGTRYNFFEWAAVKFKNSGYENERITKLLHDLEWAVEDTYYPALEEYDRRQEGDGGTD